MISILFLSSQDDRGVVILSERAARARAKDLLADDRGTKGVRGTRASEGSAVYAGASSRTARPAAARFASFISEYLRDRRTPWAPP